jgi:micrococcal nuclease
MRRLPSFVLLVAMLGTGCAPVAPAATPALSSLAPASPAPASLAPAGALEEASVIRVVDGDTLIVDRGTGEERLRYIGVDAPESVRPDTPVEFYGREASAANTALVDGATIWLETDVSDRDRFGRLLRYAWLRDGDAWTLVNRELVRQGFAQAVSFPPDVRWQDELRAAEREARDAGRGLWGPPTPAPS